MKIHMCFIGYIDSSHGYDLLCVYIYNCAKYLKSGILRYFAQLYISLCLHAIEHSFVFR